MGYKIPFTCWSPVHIQARSVANEKVLSDSYWFAQEKRVGGPSPSPNGDPLHRRTGIFMTFQCRDQRDRIIKQRMAISLLGEKKTPP